jgi:hypothetical protein
MGYRKRGEAVVTSVFIKGFEKAIEIEDGKTIKDWKTVKRALRKDAGRLRELADKEWRRKKGKRKARFDSPDALMERAKSHTNNTIEREEESEAPPGCLSIQSLLNKEVADGQAGSGDDNLSDQEIADQGAAKS